MAASCSRMPPGSPMPRGLMCRVAIATPCTTARSTFGITRSTSPRRPLLTPEITTTVSPLRMRAAIIVSPTRGTSQHLGRERHDLGEFAGPQFTHHRAEDACADRLQLLVDQHGRVAVEANCTAVAASHRKSGAHDDGLVHITLLHLAARYRLFDRHDDNITHRSGLPLRAAQHLDALNAARTGVVRHFQIGLDRDHAAAPSLARTSPLRS